MAEKFSGIKFGKFQIGYRSLITLTSLLVLAWLLTKNLCCDSEGVKWIPNSDIKVELKR